MSTSVNVNSVQNDERKENANHSDSPPPPTHKPSVTKSNGIKCFYTNTDQLNNKLEELILFSKEHDIDIIALNETLPKNCSNEVPVFIIPGYECFPDNEGRGVCIFVKNSFEVKHITDIEDMYSPSIFLKINVTKNRSFVFATIYRSPNCIETDHDNICKQIDAISKRYSKLDDKVVICGDFNYPDINWNTVTCTRNNINKSCMFLNTIQENFLYQIIKEPTHHRCQQTPTLIDLILTNDVNLVNNVDHFPPFGKSHHSVICFSLDIEPPPITA